MDLTIVGSRLPGGGLKRGRFAVLIKAADSARLHVVVVLLRLRVHKEQVVLPC